MSGGVAAAYTNDIPGGNIADPVVRAVDIAQPAVVRIITQVNGTLTVQFSSGAVTFPRTGNGGYPLTLSGSGTFIGAHGDVLTADHVVNPPQADLDTFLQQTASQDIATYMNQVLKVNPQVTPNQVAQELAGGQLTSRSQYQTPQSAVYLSTAFTGPLSATTFQSIPANVFSAVDRIEAQSSFNQNDVAIIHVNNMDNMPMVQLGNSAGVQTQDQLTIIGFPGNGDVSTTPTNLLTSSVNIVNVSSIKTTDTGAPVIQVGGNVEHGDSGGPALDSSGSVVGIVSFGSNGPGSTSFLQASSSAQQLVQQLKLDTTPGTFQTAWSQAFNEYSATTTGHWHKAAQELQQLAISFPQFKGVTRYLTYAQQQASTEKLPATTPTHTATPTHATSASSFLSGNGPLLVGGGVLVLGLLLFGVVIVRRRSAKPAPAKSEPPAYATLPNGATPNPNPFTPISGNGANVAPNPQAQQPYQPQPQNGAAAFGAPLSSWPSPNAMQPSAQANTVANSTEYILVPWPCGHMNRRVARFCSVCGEPAPKQQPPQMRRYEQ